MGRIHMLDGCFKVGEGVEIRMPSCPEGADHGLWTDGDVIYARTEKKACGVATFLELMGYDVVTGVYEKEEDERDGCVDKYTGWWYVEIE